jgi:hypothetical protein
MEEPKAKGKDVLDTYFTTAEGSSRLHKCKECSQVLNQDITRGYSSLTSHVTIIHKDDY